MSLTERPSARPDVPSDVSSAHDGVLVVVPAPLHGADMLRHTLRRLAGRPLLLRMLDTLRPLVADPAQVVVLADDDEVALVAERQGCTVRPLPAEAGLEDRTFAGALHEIVSAIERDRTRAFDTIVIVPPVSPMLRTAELTAAIARFAASDYDSLRSARRTTPHRTGADAPLVATDTFVITRPRLLASGTVLGVRIDLADVPAEQVASARTPHEWWVCERLLGRRRVVFVVIGYSTVGLGHVYRASLIAHELASDHDVVFVCPDDSSLAQDVLRSQGVAVHAQGGRDLADAVLALAPDVVITDMLNTERTCVERLKSRGARVVTFEDLGTGASAADLVINDIFYEADARPNHLNGPDYFCIRDEFLDASPRRDSGVVREVLVTFGGTDAVDSTSRVAGLILPVAVARGVHVSFVVGPGYLHLDRLRVVLAGFPSSVAELANGTKRMSEYMARSDLAFSSAGRTVFELAAMQVPAVILAANEREESHTFAAPANGFVYLGRADRVGDNVVTAAFVRLLDAPAERQEMRMRMARWDFREGRARVLAALRPLLDAGQR